MVVRCAFGKNALWLLFFVLLSLGLLRSSFVLGGAVNMCLYHSLSHSLSMNLDCPSNSLVAAFFRHLSFFHSCFLLPFLARPTIHMCFSSLSSLSVSRFSSSISFLPL